MARHLASVIHDTCSSGLLGTKRGLLHSSCQKSSVASEGEEIIATFMFCTGIENSVPTIGDGRIRIDEMLSCGHYQHWQEDF